MCWLSDDVWVLSLVTRLPPSKQCQAVASGCAGARPPEWRGGRWHQGHWPELHNTLVMVAG